MFFCLSTTFFRCNFPHSLLEIGPGKPYLCSTSEAFQPKIHPGAHDLKGIASAGMWFLQFKNVTNIDFQSHFSLRQPQGQTPWGQKQSRGLSLWLIID